MYVCVCVCAYMHVCVHYVCEREYESVCVGVCGWVGGCAFVCCVCVHVHVHVYACETIQREWDGVLSCSCLFLGSQLRSWLLYFSLPVLDGILQEPYFSHFCYLVAGVHIVMSDAISSTDLSNAQLCFEKFYSEMSTLYGTRFYYSIIVVEW